MSDTSARGRARNGALSEENRIYVNRNLRLATVQAVGFDLDHTLAHYRGAAVEELAYRLARRILVERFGYPRKILEFPYDRTHVIRGLVIDKRRGNVLKMDYHNYVAQGCHGFHMLASTHGDAHAAAREDTRTDVDSTAGIPLVLRRRSGRHGGRVSRHAG